MPDDLPTVIHHTPDELRTQRARLIASTGLTEEALHERGDAFQLYPEHLAIWNTVQGIDYLLDQPDIEDEASTVPDSAEPEPLILPRDAAVMLHAMLGDLLADTSRLRTAIYYRLNREADFIGCPDETTDDIMQLIADHNEVNK